MRIHATSDMLLYQNSRNLKPTFYTFKQSLHSHASKAHFHSPSETAVRCHLCPAVCNSKSGIRRHLRVSHGTDELPQSGFTHKCKLVV